MISILFLFSSPEYFLLRLPCFHLSHNKVMSASLQSLPHWGAASSDNTTARHGMARHGTANTNVTASKKSPPNISLCTGRGGTYSSLHYKMYPTKVTNETIFLTNSRGLLIQR